MPGDFIPAGPYVPEGGAAALVADAINDGTTTVAPSQNAVFDALALKAPIASPTFTGTPAAPTAAAGTNTTQVATTAYVQTEAGLLLPKLDLSPPTPVGEYSHCTPGSTSYASTPISINVIGFTLMYIPFSIDRLGLTITSGVASATMRLGLYTRGSDGYPKASIVLPSGTISTATTGTADYTVSNGPIGWCCAVFQSGGATNPSIRAAALGGLAAMAHPFSTPRSSSTLNTLVFSSRSDAALPSDLTGFTWSLVTTGSWGIAQVRRA